MNLLYIANIRLPTEKAHGLQIMQNCEAFADAGANVTLWVARRTNTPEMQAIDDPWAYYGVRRNFTVRRVPCIDLLPLVPGRTDAPARLIFYFQMGTFVMAALVMALFARADHVYSRDALTLLAMSLIKPRRVLVYESHTLAPSRGGRSLQQQVVRRVGCVIAVTEKLRQEMVKLGVHESHTLTAHDGIRRERFEHLPTRAEARRSLGWPEDAFIVGYVGRLQTMAMDKGVGTLAAALQTVDGATIALVGGPDDAAMVIQQAWLDAGMPAERFLQAGHVKPDRVPIYLAAFDVCAMPFPWTEHFAYYASPIKLFEYMVVERAVVASDLPAFSDVVTDGEHALLVPPGETAPLAAAITRLRDDAALRLRLGENARRRALDRYTWAARAQAILHLLEGIR